MWFGKSTAADLLAGMARTGQTISHDALDALPPGRDVNYIREILVRTEVLPPRNEYLERIEPWLDRHLMSYPAEHGRLVRNYAVWYLLHRVRRSKRQLGRAGAQRIRNQVRVALEFLAWIEERGSSLTAMDQGDVNAWLANGYWRHREIRPFCTGLPSAASPTRRRHQLTGPVNRRSSLTKPTISSNSTDVSTTTPSTPICVLAAHSYCSTPSAPPAYWR